MAPATAAAAAAPLPPPPVAPQTSLPPLSVAKVKYNTLQSVKKKNNPVGMEACSSCSLWMPWFHRISQDVC